MRVVVQLPIAKLTIICVCAAGLWFGSYPDLLCSQSMPAQANATAEPRNNTMTRIGYKEDQGDLHAEMELQSIGAERRLVISFRRKNGEPSTLQDQARLVDVLLARVLHDHSELVSLEVMFGEGRGSFIPPLDAYLAQSRDWNSRTGLPRHGRLGDYLVQVFNSQGVLEPLKTTFKRSGFAFRLDGVNRIDIQKIPTMNNARLPKYIDIMYFSAKKMDR